MKAYLFVSLLSLWSFMAHALPGRAESQAISATEAQAIAEEAYIYFYPLLTMDITRRVMTNGEPDGKGRGPANTFQHLRTFPTADMKDVVRPNFDTLYSLAWLDLSKGPVIVSTPNTEGRYYLLPMLDMWTDVFAVPGKRTTGTQAGHYAITPVQWQGQLPEGVQRVDAPTTFVWIIGRTQTNTAQDYAQVHSIQDGFRATPLDQWGNEPVTPVITNDPSVDMSTPPLDQVNALPASEYFRTAMELLKVNSPHITDTPILERMKRIGLEPGQSLDLTNKRLAKTLALGASSGLRKIRLNALKVGSEANGWRTIRDLIGVYGNAYLTRATIALVGLGANLPEDAIYPLAVQDSKGRPLSGAYNYVLHFDADQLPPVNAFWSLTMYDAGGFVVANPLNRFALGDRDALQYNKDGSLDLYIQHESPGPNRESNWLPAPEGPLGLTMRLYAPKDAALDGTWNPPALLRVN